MCIGKAEKRKKSRDLTRTGRCQLASAAGGFLQGRGTGEKRGEKGETAQRDGRHELGFNVIRERKGEECEEARRGGGTSNEACALRAQKKACLRSRAADQGMTQA